MSEDAPGPLWRQLAWFIGLWAAGLASVAALAYVLRWVLQP